MKTQERSGTQICDFDRLTVEAFDPDCEVAYNLHHCTGPDNSEKDDSIKYRKLYVWDLISSRIRLRLG